MRLRKGGFGCRYRQGRRCRDLGGGGGGRERPDQIHPLYQTAIGFTAHHITRPQSDLSLLVADDHPCPGPCFSHPLVPDFSLVCTSTNGDSKLGVVRDVQRVLART